MLDIEPLPTQLPEVDFIYADIRNPNEVLRACRGVSHVIHTVAKVPISKAGRGFWEVNVGGTRNILEAAMTSSVRKVVHISSSAVQISETNPVPEEAPYHPVGDYAKSKMEAEEVCREYIQKGLAIDRIRPRTVIGAGRLGIFDILFDWLLEGRKIYILGKGENKIQFLHVGDLAACCYLSSRVSGSEIFNVGARSFGTLREDLQSLVHYAKTNSKLVSLPVAPAVALLSVLDVLRLSPLASWHYLTYFKDFYFNNEKAKNVLGWEPQYGNQEILRMAYDSYQELRRRPDFRFGQSHRKGLKQGILAIIKKLS